MMKLKNQSLRGWHDGIAFVRIVVGVMLMFQGSQIFEKQDMINLSELLANAAVPYSESLAYLAKVVELAGGLFLILGLYTRLMTALLFVAFIFMTFVIGEGRILADNQLPFLFALISLLFFFAGAGRLSIDYILLINRKEPKPGSRMAVTRRFGQYVSKT